ncbi:MAG TPA: hypothetical protein VJR03_07335 [Nitrospira sp.]|nr:hypothetical protein [Nitrospira sp.]
MLDQENKLPHVIAVGPSLTGKLESLKEVFAGSQITYEVRYGDAEYPLGGGGPGYQLYFLADGKRVLALRLAYDIFLPNLCRSRINRSARAGESAFPLTLPTTSSVQST